MYYSYDFYINYLKMTELGQTLCALLVFNWIYLIFLQLTQRDKQQKTSFQKPLLGRQENWP